MPKIRYYKAYKLKPGKTKIQGRTYKIQPLKKPRNLPKGSGLLIPLKKENNPEMAKKKKKRSKKKLPPRDPKTGRFRKRKKRRKSRRGKKKKKKRGNPNNCLRYYKSRQVW